MLESLAWANSEKCYVFLCYAADNRKPLCFYHSDYSVIDHCQHPSLAIAEGKIQPSFAHLAWLSSSEK